MNQFNYGFARYNGPTYNPNQGGDFAASAAGITGLPLPSRHSNAFPLITFAGNGSLPTSWAGSVANGSIANAYIASDNFQMALGKHAITVGVQVKWLEYNYTINGTGTSPSDASRQFQRDTGVPLQDWRDRFVYARQLHNKSRYKDRVLLMRVCSRERLTAKL